MLENINLEILLLILKDIKCKFLVHNGLDIFIRCVHKIENWKSFAWSICWLSGFPSSAMSLRVGFPSLVLLLVHHGFILYIFSLCYFSPKVMVESRVGNHFFVSRPILLIVCFDFNRGCGWKSFAWSTFKIDLLASEARKSSPDPAFGADSHSMTDPSLAATCHRPIGREGASKS